MTDLNPTEIYRRYQRNELDKTLAVDYLKSIIESSSDEQLRVRSVELLGEMNLGLSEIFEFFEQLITSDENENVRLESLKITVRDFFDESIDTIHYAIKHESSANNLYTLYKELEIIESEVSDSLRIEMELSIGEKYIKKFKLIPKEAMALQLINLIVGTEATHVFYWHDESCFAVEPKDGKVVDLVIYEYNFPEIKFLDLFSQLTSLTISNAGIKEMANLQTLSNLNFLDLGFNEIKEIKGLETLTELKTLNMNDNPIKKIEGIDHLKHLEDFNFEDTLISEEDYYDFCNQFIPYLLKDAHSYWFTKKYDKAIEKCKRVLELDPEQTDAYYYLGLVYYETKDLLKSISYYKNAIKINRKLKKAWYHLGISYFDLNKNILARNAFLFALKFESTEVKDESIWIYLAEIYSRRSLYKQALKSGFKAIKINPKYARAYTHIGYYYYTLRGYNDAILMFKKAIELDTSSFFPRNYIGLSLMRLGKFEESKIVFEKVLALRPKDSTARVGLGLIHVNFNQSREAIKHFKRVANNKNLNYAECYTLASNFQKLEAFNLADNLVHRGLNLNPQNKKLKELKKNLKIYKKISPN